MKLLILTLLALIGSSGCMSWGESCNEERGRNCSEGNQLLECSLGTCSIEKGAVSTPVASTSLPNLRAGETLRVRADIRPEFTEIEIVASTDDLSMITVLVDGAPVKRLASDRFRLPRAASNERTVDVVVSNAAPSPILVQVSTINPEARCRVCRV